ncbi:hypothetical protein [Oceanidesulfovibrio marinus]|uniref:DUF4013 domain-containing protein n=1 Tax=Oceanidesulfovibrio marinus TaxID=370038 RepID=A0ABX6NA16_9BACT|nr:hypothetical protein [Oceanidesulfovibrio marinus]QJT07432.1 hypothetical protein E8L03_00220 [Oceanidesulfovibrio marinus]
MRYRIGAMHIGQILDTAFEVFRDHSKTLLAITAVVFGPYLILYFGSAFSGVWPVFKIISAYKAGAWNTYREHYWEYAIGLGVFTFLHMVFTVYTRGALAIAMASMYLNHPVSTSTSIRFMASRWWPIPKTFFMMLPYYTWSSIGMIFVLFSIAMLGNGVTGNVLMFTIFIFVGTAMTLVSSIAYGRLCLAFNVVILEDLSGWKAIRRSVSLMGGSWWQGVVLYLARFVLGLVLVGAMRFIPSDYAIFMLGVFINILLLSFFIAASVVLYFSTRSKRENFDIEYMAQYATA